MNGEITSVPLILVVEDEAIIALGIHDELQDAGYRGAGPFTTCSAAIEWLQAATPDAAILDAVLKDGPCRDIALALRRRRVPFLIYSGHRENHPTLGEFHHATWIEKPAPAQELVEACQRLLVGCD